jgi:hypothetical protein
VDGRWELAVNLDGNWSSVANCELCRLNGW